VLHLHPELVAQIEPEIPDQFNWKLHDLVMLKNYFKIALRIFSRQKAYTLINISGLAIGLSGALLIFGYIINELNYDRIHPSAKNTYRLAANYINDDGSVEKYSYAPALWSDQLKTQFPEVLARLRTMWIGYPYSVSFKEKDKIVLTEELYYTDPEYNEVFSFDVVAGDEGNPFREINSIALNESTAKNIFGNDNPIGRILTIKHPWATNDKELDLIVTAIFRDYPSNTSFKPSYLVPIESLRPFIGSENYDAMFTGWSRGWMVSYAVFRNDADIKMIENEFKKVVSENVNMESGEIIPFFKKMVDLHFDEELAWYMEGMGDITQLFIFASIAIFLILIACINYINLATARSVKRSREVGLRKMMGCSRIQLIFQFLNESFIITLLALFLSILIVALVLPVFNNLAQKDFVFLTFFNIKIIAAAIALVIIVTILAGCYPAFYLSKFEPAEVFKVGRVNLKGAFSLKKVLIVFQLSISSIMLICSGVLIKQINYINESKLNAQGDQMILIRYGGIAPMEKYTVYKNVVLQDPDLTNITTCNHLPRLDHFAWIGTTTRIPDVNDQEYQWSELKGDFDFSKVFNLEFLTGRDFIEGNPADSNACLINEAAVKKLGMDLYDAVGLQLEDTRTERILTVIGIVRDFQYRSTHHTIEPLIISARPDRMDQIVYVKLPVGNVQEHIQTLESKWKEIFPGIAFDYWFLDQEFSRMYSSEIRMSKLSEIFTLIAIFIACLGLFGLASYMAEQRANEISIRKVFGASVKQIAVWFLKKFLFMLLISIVLAGPLGYFLMNKWLQQFAYHISIDFKIILNSIGIIIGLTILAISYKMITASTANPAEAIKIE
jgi:putative ABC transport system permease protein